MKRKHNFTLLELLLVITIIAILALMLLPQFKNFQNYSEDLQCKASLSNTYIAVNNAASKGSINYNHNLSSNPETNEDMNFQVTRINKAIWPKEYTRLARANGGSLSHAEAFTVPSDVNGYCPTGTTYSQNTFVSYTLGADSLESFYESNSLASIWLPEFQLLAYEARSDEGEDHFGGLVKNYQGYNYHSRTEDGEYIVNARKSGVNLFPDIGFYCNNVTFSGAIKEDHAYNLTETGNYTAWTGESHTPDDKVYTKKYKTKSFNETQSQTLIVGGRGNDKGPNHLSGFTDHDPNFYTY